MRWSVLLLVLLASPLAAAPPEATACAGKELDLDTVARECLVDGLTEPERITPRDALQLQLEVTPPDQRGGPIVIVARVVNISGDAVVIDLPLTEIERHPQPALLLADGFRVGNERDPSCAELKPESTGGLGSRNLGRRSVARVTLPHRGALVTRTTLPARLGLCECSKGDAGGITYGCTPGRGGPVPEGTYGLSLSMPVAVTRDDGLAAYGLPYKKVDIDL